MSMQELLEQEKSSLIDELSVTANPTMIRSILDKTLDRILLLYNENAREEPLQKLAAQLMAVARTAPAFVDSTNPPTVWECKAAGSDPGPEPFNLQKEAAAKPQWRFALCLIVGVSLLLVGLIAFTITLPAPPNLSSFLLTLLFAAMGGALLFAAGLFRRSGRTQGGSVLTAQVSYDPEKIYRNLLGIVLAIDHCLEEARRNNSSYASSPAAVSMDTTATLIDPIGTEQLALFTGLLEAQYSQDGAFALDELSNVKHYLHRQGIELMDDLAEHPDWFDKMPSRTSGVLRPALSRNGACIVRGLAAVPEKNLQ